jgi:hypothetical protein
MLGSKFNRVLLHISCTRPREGGRERQPLRELHRAHGEKKENNARGATHLVDRAGGRSAGRGIGRANVGTIARQLVAHALVSCVPLRNNAQQVA